LREEALGQDADLVTAPREVPLAVVVAEPKGQDADPVAATRERLVATYLKAGKIDEAERVVQEALRAQEALPEGRQWPIVRTLNELGLIRRRQARFDEAEQLYRRALATASALGRDEEALATPSARGRKLEALTGEVLHNLAFLYMTEGKASEADGFFRRALAVREAVDSPRDAARTLAFLVDLAEASERHQDAVNYGEKLLRNLERVGGPDSPALIPILQRQTRLLREVGRTDDAAKLETRAESIRAHHPREAAELDREIHEAGGSGNAAKADIQGQQRSDALPLQNG
jgi:tetratricopeptide (TPR) repeat protein